MLKNIIVVMIPMLWSVLIAGDSFDPISNKLGKNFSDIIKEYAKECAENQPSACQMLSTLVIQSTKSNQGMEKAVQSSLKACEDGEALGCTLLGRMYADGKGIEQNASKAVKFYVKGCEGKEAIGCMMAGIMYAEGKVLEQNYSKSLNLLDKSCDYGANIGCTTLALMYLKGVGSEKNVSKAVELFTKACNGNESLGCANLAFLYKKGIGVNQDAIAAEQLQSKACAIGITIKNQKIDCSQIEEKIIDKGMIAEANHADDEKIATIKKLYAEKFDQLSEEERTYLIKNFYSMRSITQDILNRYGHGRIPDSINVTDRNLIEFYLYPDGSISDIRFIKKSKLAFLDDVTREVIELSYVKYERPRQKTRIRYQVFYNLSKN